MERMEALTNYYTTHNEDARLTPKRGMVEFLTTIHYVEKYLKPGMRILEIGAGTGRYSHYFAQNGYDVAAVELMECNIEVFKSNTKDGENITVQQGDAVNLQNIASDQYDITLLLGPMYHLYTDEDKLAAMSEAIRVTKKGGIVFAAYCNNDIFLRLCEIIYRVSATPFTMVSVHIYNHFLQYSHSKQPFAKKSPRCISLCLSVLLD